MVKPWQVTTIWRCRLRLLRSSIILLHFLDHVSQITDQLNQLLNWSKVTPVMDEACRPYGCTGGDMGVGALLFEQFLVFFDVVFLDDIVFALLSFLPKNRLGPFL